ncbi:MAG: histidine kinase [Rhodococcus sp. (in: high G+C Gram-positive bacteria)]
MRNVPGRAGSRYLEAGSFYVAATLLVLAWGDIITLLGRSELRFHRPVTWVCLAFTLAALVGLSYLIVRASRGADAGSATFRKEVRWFVVAALATSGISAVVGTTAYPGLVWQSTLVIICAAFALALVSTTRGLIAGVVAVPLCLLLTGQPAALFFFAGSMFFNLLFVRLSLWVLGIVRELDSARRTIAVMTLEQERSRFARDLHDVMGRSLSSIALKAELGLETTDSASRDQHVRDARDIAQRALGDMRELVRGYRDVELATELDDALMLLRSASVFAEAHGDGGADLDEPSARVAGWIVREAVTNVLKHAPDATECTITVDGRVVEVINDGASEDIDTGSESDAPTADRSNGSGLIGMRERVETAGGTFSASRQGNRFHIRCDFPERGRTTWLTRRRSMVPNPI